MKNAEGSLVSSTGRIYRISISPHKGEKKRNVTHAVLEVQHGLTGDAHAGSDRQVSLLPFESFEKVREKLATIAPGDFAENITTVGVDYATAKIGARLKIGAEAVLQSVQLGKKCHHGCYIKKTVGDCIMPREGIFASVLKAGQITTGDPIWWI